ncbi:hypothetical protein M2359_003436 [Gordonia amarae]|uniref:Uncharacterized protein n=1 Tax=Gordonia amarae NBRC 15530 TaxID=1075090 RepID=G7GJM2_9ACTN|nr:hypothetical protein [Gordonia amarae]MCS3879807.1 hypothetical protein [Gordonia amarae]QHN18231.1 hypothetical protein GII35_15790 [Gordonia amarae]QHN31618.1 hypothetical protein GII32_15640 [Gordonia amarae]GAB03797.1 hypothetical protein GOAMR_06_00030 [Gordonia amarae NBRC 15530]
MREPGGTAPPPIVRAADVPGTADVVDVPDVVPSGATPRGDSTDRGPPVVIGTDPDRGTEPGDPGVPVGVFNPGNDSGDDRFRLRFPGPAGVGPEVFGPEPFGAFVVGTVVSRVGVTVGSSRLLSTVS